VSTAAHDVAGAFSSGALRPGLCRLPGAKTASLGLDMTSSNMVNGYGFSHRHSQRGC
jgi:hypothetical protein